jgi:hypothetical protein
MQSSAGLSIRKPSVQVPIVVPESSTSAVTGVDGKRKGGKMMTASDTLLSARYVLFFRPLLLVCHVFSSNLFARDCLKEGNLLTTLEFKDMWNNIDKETKKVRTSVVCFLFTLNDRVD